LFLLRILNIISLRWQKKHIQSTPFFYNHLIKWKQILHVELVENPWDFLFCFTYISTASDLLLRVIEIYLMIWMGKKSGWRVKCVAPAQNSADISDKIALSKMKAGTSWTTVNRVLLAAIFPFLLDSAHWRKKRFEMLFFHGFNNYGWVWNLDKFKEKWMKTERELLVVFPEIVFCS